MADNPKSNGAQGPDDSGTGISTIDDLIGSSQDAAAPDEGQEEPKATTTPEGEGESPEPGTQEGTQAGEEGAESAEDKGEGEDDLREQLKSQQELLQRMIAGQQQPRQQEPSKDDKSQQQQEPDFSFNIPQELVTLMESEDANERRQGLALYAQGIARAAYQTAAQQLQQLREQHIPTTVQSLIAMHEQARTVAEDFYGSNPDLNKAELRPFVRETARVVAQETGAQSWTPELKAAVEKRVRQTLGLKKPAPPPKPKPPARLPKGGGGQRPDAGQNSESEDILRTIF